MRMKTVYGIHDGPAMRMNAPRSSMQLMKSTFLRATAGRPHEPRVTVARGSAGGRGDVGTRVRAATRASANAAAPVRGAPLHLAVVLLRVAEDGHLRVVGVAGVAVRLHVFRFWEWADVVAHLEDCDVVQANFMQICHTSVPTLLSH